MAWLQDHALYGILLLAVPFVVSAAYNWIAVQAADALEKAVDAALEWGDPEWDTIILRVVGKIEHDIPDDITSDNAAVQRLAIAIGNRGPIFGVLRIRRQRVAEGIVRVFKALDKRAKKIIAEDRGA